jgi:hypothetical protein
MRAGGECSDQDSTRNRQKDLATVGSASHDSKFRLLAR